MDPVLTVSVERVRETDAAAAALVFRFELSEPAAGEVRVTVETVDGTAIAGIDYQALAPQDIVFAPGERLQTVDIIVLGDNVAEPEESFGLSILAVQGASYTPTPEQSPFVVATIEDDDTSDTLFGTEGADTLSGDADPEKIVGLGGADDLSGNGGGDELVGGAGVDTLSGGDGLDTLFGNSGDDELSGGPDADSLVGGSGADSLSGDGGDDTLKGGPEDDTLLGGADDDSLVGGPGDDSLVGADGNDTLQGGDQADALQGDTGADYLDGGPGSDTIDGGTEADTLLGGAAADTLLGGSGDDVILAGEGFDSLVGDDGNDDLDAGPGNDTVTGGLGDDTVNGGAGDDDVDLGDGDDTAFGFAGADSLVGGGQNDSLEGGDGLDTVIGGLGDDTLSGGPAADRVEGGMGNDSASGGFGDDTLEGGEGDDTLSGNDGADSVSGGIGSDSLRGGASTDTLSGGTGDDWMFGGGNADSLLGDEGEDTLDGGDGADTLIGGAGSDTLLGGRGGDEIRHVFDANPLTLESVDGGQGTDKFVFTVAERAFNDLGLAVADLHARFAAGLGGPDPIDFTDLGFTLLGIEEFVVDLVGPFNGAPEAQDDQAGTSYETAVEIDLFADNGNGVDSDPDGDPLSVVALSDPAHGSLEDLGGGLVRYTPDLAYSGADSFTYTVSDGFGGTAQATVSLTVDPRPNTDPDAKDDAVTMEAGSPVTISVLEDYGQGPDTDADGDNLTVTSVSTPGNGTAVIDGTDKVIYTPNAGFSGVDTFTYTVDDGSGGSDTATVTVTVEDPLPEGAIVVNTAADTVANDGLTSLREAVSQARDESGDNVIVFDLPVDTVITLTQGQITLNSKLTVWGDIDKDGDADVTIAGTGSSRVFRSTANGVVLEAVNITGGGGVSEGGGILNSGSLTILDSSIVGNSSSSTGGGIRNSGTLKMSGSYVADNETGNDGGGIFNTKTATIVNTTIVDNHADVVGGGLGNSAQGGSTGSAIATLRNVTITGNTADDFAGGVGNSATLRIYNTIIAGNKSPDSGTPEIAQYGSFSGGGNLFGQNGFGGSNLFVRPRDLDDVFAQFVNLGGGVKAGLAADNGGLTKTVALKAHSSNEALDAGLDNEADDLDGSTMTADQRGEGYNRIEDLSGIPSENGSSDVDIGAYELQISDYLIA